MWQRWRAEQYAVICTWKESVWLLRDEGEAVPPWVVHCFDPAGNSSDFEQTGEMVVFWSHFEGRATDFAAELDKGCAKKKSSRMLLQINSADRLPRLEPTRAGWRLLSVIEVKRAFPPQCWRRVMSVDILTLFLVSGRKRLAFHHRGQCPLWVFL